MHVAGRKGAASVSTPVRVVRNRVPASTPYDALRNVANPTDAQCDDVNGLRFHQRLVLRELATVFFSLTSTVVFDFFYFAAYVFTACLKLLSVYLSSSAHRP